VQKRNDILSNLLVQGTSCDKRYVEKPFYPGLVVYSSLCLEIDPVEWGPCSFLHI
jgi:hypothetical protein